MIGVLLSLVCILLSVIKISFAFLGVLLRLILKLISIPFAFLSVLLKLISILLAFYRAPLAFLNMLLASLVFSISSASFLPSYYGLPNK